MFNVSVLNTLNFRFFYSAVTSRGRNGQLLEVIHKYLKAHIICQDSSASTLLYTASIHITHVTKNSNTTTTVTVCEKPHMHNIYIQ